MGRRQTLRKTTSQAGTGGFLRSVQLVRDRVGSFDRYPFAMAAVRALDELALHPKVTFFIGENGSGKSTLLEAIAVAAGFNAEGGSKNFRFATRPSESDLHEALRIVRNPTREHDGFFLRAESLFNVATEIETIQREAGGWLLGAYGGVSLHEQSHGESFLALAKNRFRGNGLYILDEPEAALSPSRQLAMLRIVDDLVVRRNSQFLIATHSPILMAYPHATIYEFGADGIRATAYAETEHYRLTRDFLASPATFLRKLFDEE